MPQIPMRNPRNIKVAAAIRRRVFPVPLSDVQRDAAQTPLELPRQIRITTLDLADERPHPADAIE